MLFMLEKDQIILIICACLSTYLWYVSETDSYVGLSSEKSPCPKHPHATSANSLQKMFRG